jgi:hypothetical protein
MTSQGTGPRSNTEEGLPAIVSVEASRVKYDPPRRFYEGREPIEVRDGVELLVQTAAALPVRAVSPVLFIGETAIDEYEVAGANLYRFFVFNLQRVQPGAAISIGWPFARQMARQTNFRFQIPGNLPVT